MRRSLRLRFQRLTLAAAPLMLIAAPAQASSEDDWGIATDAGVAVLIGWSLAVPIEQGDRSGALAALASMGAAQGTTQILKHTIPTVRPDGSDRRSFPSGHTSTAFAAATSILERRGVEEGIPALAVAGMVGVGRVQARKHYWGDVLADAAIGTASGLLLTSPRQAPHRVMVAWGDTSSIGFSFVAAF